VAAVRTLAEAMPVAGHGASAMNFDRGDGDRTTDAAYQLAAAALGAS
jgi:hypothetical protein